MRSQFCFLFFVFLCFVLFCFLFSTDKSTLKSIEIPKYAVTSSKVVSFMISWVGMIDST